jgi:hypothetical protein
VKTVEGMKATPGRRVPKREWHRGGKPPPPLREDQRSPPPPPGIPLFCEVCGHRFYAEVVRPVCSLACLRRRNAP